MTRPRKDVEAVRDLLDLDLPIAEVASRVGIARATGQRLGDEGLRRRSGRPARRLRGLGPVRVCRFVRDLSETTYAYLLGLYLGDGCISEHRRRVYKLRIFQDNKYPGLIRQCMVAMQWIIPTKVGIVQLEGRKEIYSFSKHWPCVFPQHGPGPQHKRSIVLEPWQRWVAVERNPELLLRGLIHSDGWRGSNRVNVRGKQYEYPRYMFSNRSAEIRGIFTDACDRAGIDWRQNLDWSIAISRQGSVERMDQFIGFKY